MSKYQSYDDCNAKCPYYKGCWRNELACEAQSVEVRTLVIRFGTLQGLRAYRRAYCDSLRGHETCPLYAVHDD